MTSAVYDNAVVHFGIGEVNWTTGQTDIYATLCGNTAPTKTHAHYSDITGQLGSGSGYTTGGMVFPSLVTAALASNVVQFDGGDCAWTASTFTAYFAITNHGTLAGATNALLSYHDLGGAQSVVSGTLTLQWAATGVFTITVSAAT
jgi:hypothetical protein